MLAIGDRLHLHNIWSRNIFPFSMEGCVFYAPLWQEDVQGTTLISYDQYHHSCSVTGTVWSNQGRVYDGNDLIDCGNSPVLQVQNFTLIAWINSGGVGGRCIIGNSNIDTDRNGFYFGLSNVDKPVIEVSSATAFENLTATAAITNGVWTHIAATVSADTFTHYTNGVANGTAATRTLTITYSYNLYLGSSPAGGPLPLTGTIGEVWIYNRVLSASEIANHHYVTKGRYM